MNLTEGTLSVASDHTKRPANSHLNFKRHAQRLGTLAECLDSVSADRVGRRLACDPFGLRIERFFESRLRILMVKCSCSILITQLPFSCSCFSERKRGIRELP
ncbi:uncharacterized [Tachysurus ichikawai]